MRVDVEIDTDFLLKSRFKLTLKIIDKFSYPAIMLIVLLAVADKDVIFVPGLCWP
jgi:hypothetical protein